MSGRVVSTVSVVVDLPLTVPHLPERGGDVLGAASPPTPGGGFNTAAAAARQGVTTLLASPLGTGPYADLAAAALAREGIGVVIPAASDGDTGLCITIVEPDGERTFLTSPGVEAHLRADQLAAVTAAPGDVVVVSGYDLAYPSGAVLAHWVEGLAPGVVVLLDPGPLVAEIPRAVLDPVLRRADVVSLNERETALLAGPAAVRALLAPHTLALHRRGPVGCAVEWDDDGHGDDDGDVTLVPSLAVAVVDSTGAGDAHTGVLAAELVELVSSRPLATVPRPAVLRAVARANAAAAITVTRSGPATCPTRAEIDAALADLATAPRP